MPRIVVFAAMHLVLLGSLTGPAVIGIPAAIARLVAQEERSATLAAVLLAGAIAALVANPIFGFLSDRSRSRFGRRRPWLLGGVLVGLAACALLVVADSVLLLAAGWVLAQVGYNAALAALAALFGEQIEEERRAAAAGVFAAAAFLGALPPLAIAALMPGRTDLLMLVMPAVAVLVVAVSAAMVHDVPRDVMPSRRAVTARVRRRTLRPPAAFVWVWIQRMLMHVAFSLATAFGLYFAMARLDLDTEAASSIIGVATLLGGAGIVAASLITGMLAARKGKYGSVIALAAIGLAVAAAVRAGAHEHPAQLWLASLLGGLALGAFYAVDLALVLRTVPKGQEGVYLGGFNVAETLPQTLAPTLALALLAVGAGDPLSGSSDNFVALYGAAALVALLAALPLLGLRSVVNRREPAQEASPPTEPAGAPHP